MIAITKPPRTRYAVIYARFSDRRDAAKCQSVKAQIVELKAQCEAAGYVIRGIYRDNAISGKSIGRRRGLRRAFKAVKRGDVFICRDTSRLARHLFDSFYLVRKLLNRGVIFETTADGIFDPKDPNKLLLFGMKAIVAEGTRLQISKDTRRETRRRQMPDGKGVASRMSKVIPYGMRQHPTDDKLMIVHPEESAVIETILEIRQNNGGEPLGARAIARELDTRGIPFRGRLRWNHTTIRKILKREVKV